MATNNAINNTSNGITVTGTANINTTGAAVTSIGTGGTGAVNIGNTTGNTAVTGSLTATTTLTASSGDITATNGDSILGNTDAAVTAPFVYFKKSRSGGVITSGDDLGEVAFQGHDGTQYITGSRIRSDNSGTVATNRIASNLEFYTHPDSTSASTLRMTIASTGAVTIASPDSGTGLTVSGGGLTVTSGAITATSGNVVVTAGNLTLPNSNAAGTQGLITFNAIRQLSNPGTNSIFVGESGTLNNTGYHNFGAGYQALTSLTSGKSNTCVGKYAGIFLTTGSGNVLLGAINDATGSGSSPFGVGGTYTTSESWNILINNQGVVAESNVLRIGGGTGTGATQLNKAFISGIYNTAVGATAGVVLADSSNQLGGLAGSSGTVLVGGTKPAFTALNTLAVTSLSGTSNQITASAAVGSVTLSIPSGFTAPGSVTSTTTITAGTGLTVSAGGIVFTSTGTNGITSIDTYGRTVGGTNAAVLIDNTGLFGTTTSSARFKQNITDMGDRSSSLMKLRPVNFSFKKDRSNYMQWGLIAEEVAEVMPEIVNYDEEGLPFSVRYHEMPAILLNEMQKMEKRIRELEAKLEGR